MEFNNEQPVTTAELVGELVGAAAVAVFAEVTIAVEMCGFVEVSSRSIEDHNRVPLGRSVLSIVPPCVLSRQRRDRMGLVISRFQFQKLFNREPKASDTETTPNHHELQSDGIYSVGDKNF